MLLVEGCFMLLMEWYRWVLVVWCWWNAVDGIVLVECINHSNCSSYIVIMSHSCLMWKWLFKGRKGVQNILKIPNQINLIMLFNHHEMIFCKCHTFLYLSQNIHPILMDFSKDGENGQTPSAVFRFGTFFSPVSA